MISKELKEFIEWLDDYNSKTSFKCDYEIRVMNKDVQLYSCTSKTIHDVIKKCDGIGLLYVVSTLGKFIVYDGGDI